MTGLNLPKKCAVMLLPDCTLFPHGGLPLHIFEPRYRTMLSEALAGECVFAVGRSRKAGGGAASSIGTAGLIRASREQHDGTSQLFLHGVIRVRFTKWFADKPYPCALIEPVISDTMDPKIGAAAMATLRGAVEDGIAGLPEDVRSGVLALLDQADEPSLMADLVAQQFIHDPDLRQALLETVSTGDRIRILCEFFAKL